MGFEQWKMGLASLFCALVITLPVALTTYLLIISANASLKQDFFDPVKPLSSSSVDPVMKMPLGRFKTSSEKRLFHTVVMASDSVYDTWQCRIMYYWFKKFKNGTNAEMGGFTRILHSGERDKFMDEIPTYVAEPYLHGTDEEYIVINRPWAYQHWLENADIEEDYILMAEPDHIIVKPIPNLSTYRLGAAFHYLPKEYESLFQKFYPKENRLVPNIDPIGNSPVIIRKASLSRILPTWMSISWGILRDPEVAQASGWVLERYAYAFSSALHNVSHILYKDFMILPPWDTEVDEEFIIHYTYGCDYDMKGKLTYGKKGEWRFDKRSYVNVVPPRNLPLPPAGVPNSVVTLVKMINEATENLPNWGA